VTSGNESLWRYLGGPCKMVNDILGESPRRKTTYMLDCTFTGKGAEKSKSLRSTLWKRDD